MPRVWLSGPRLFDGLVRPGISFSGRELAPWGKRALVVVEDGCLGIIRRPDGAIALMVTGMVPEADEHRPGMEVLYVLGFGRREDAIEVSAGALVRLGNYWLRVFHSNEFGHKVL